MKRILSFAIALLCATFSYSSFAQQASRGYRLHLPPSFATNKTVPLLVVLHAGLSNAEAIENALSLNALSDKDGFVILYPEGTLVPNSTTSRVWNAGGGCCGIAARNNIDDVLFLHELIKTIIGQYPIDTSRIFMTGHSNGSMMAYRFVCEKPDIISGMINVSGPLMINQCNKNSTDITHIHGLSDPVVPFTGGVGKSSPISFRSVDDTIAVTKSAGAQTTVISLDNTDHVLANINSALLQATGTSLPLTIRNVVMQP